MLRVRPHIARPDNQPTRVFRFPPAIEKTDPVAPPEKVFPGRIRADIRLTFANQAAHAAARNPWPRLKGSHGHPFAEP